MDIYVVLCTADEGSARIFDKMSDRVEITSDAARKRKERENETEEEAALRKEKDRLRKIEKRAKATEAEKKQERERKRMARANADEDQAEIEKEQERQRKRKARAAADGGQAEEQRAKDRQRKATARSVVAADPDAAEIEKEQERQRKRQARAAADGGQAEEQRAKDRQRKQTARAAQEQQQQAQRASVHPLGDAGSLVRIPGDDGKHYVFFLPREQYAALSHVTPEAAMLIDPFGEKMKRSPHEREMVEVCKHQLDPAHALIMFHHNSGFDILPPVNLPAGLPEEAKQRLKEDTFWRIDKLEANITPEKNSVRLQDFLDEMN